MGNFKKKKRPAGSRPEKDIILEYVSLGRGKNPRKQALAAELNLSMSGIQHRVKRFIAGNGIKRKQRSDKGIPKKDPTIQKRLEFFAELAMGSTADEAQAKLGLTTHQGNRLSMEYNKTDKWKALRNAPQLDKLKELIKDIFRIDIALVDAEMFGSFKVEVDDKIINIPSEEINDIKNILAHCVQRDEFAKLDPAYKGLSKDQLERIRVSYLKHELLEKQNITDYTRLHRAVRPNSPEKQLDLKLVYAIIDRYAPGIDETAKINIIKEEFSKLKMD